MLLRIQRSLTRFWDSGELPPLSPLQAEAVDVLEATAAREALHMILQVGDIQFVSGKHLLHARTGEARCLSGTSEFQNLCS